jgi:hypothetical protein
VDLVLTPDGFGLLVPAQDHPADALDAFPLGGLGDLDPDFLL